MKKIICALCITFSTVLFAMYHEDQGIYPVQYKSVKTSSSLKEKGKPSYYYAPSQAFDFNVKTSWCKGKEGNGTGEYVSVALKKPVPLLGLRILNGYGTTK